MTGTKRNFDHRCAVTMLVIAASVALDVSAQNLSARLRALDGEISSAERAQLSTLYDADGSWLGVQSVDGYTYLAIETHAIGVASLCIAYSDHIDVLHASAALGSLRFDRTGDDLAGLSPARGFEWALRDTSMSDEAVRARESYLAEQGWVASLSSMGAPEVAEFLIATMPSASSRPLLLAVGIMNAKEPNDVFGIPEQRAGDCASDGLVKGFELDQPLHLSLDRWIPFTMP